MSLATASEVNVTPRVQALKERHAALSREIEEAQKYLSATDTHIKQLKKRKLMVKEKIVHEEQQSATG